MCLDEVQRFSRSRFVRQSICLSVSVWLQSCTDLWSQMVPPGYGLNLRGTKLMHLNVWCVCLLFSSFCPSSLPCPSSSSISVRASSPPIWALKGSFHLPTFSCSELRLWFSPQCLQTILVVGIYSKRVAGGARRSWSDCFRNCWSAGILTHNHLGESGSKRANVQWGSYVDENAFLMRGQRRRGRLLRKATVTQMTTG